MRCTPVPMFRSPSRPASVRASDPDELTRAAVQELRNRMLVFYSATAWSRAQPHEGAAELRLATELLERFAEELRRPLLALVESLELTRDDRTLVLETGEAARRFATSSELPMTTLRRALVLYESDGMELLADLEDALARVRDISIALLAREAA
jgi:hypothetical protein